MVDSPREIVGAVLKYMGASYNAKDFDSEVTGGRNAVQQNLAALVKQVTDEPRWPRLLYSNMISFEN